MHKIYMRQEEQWFKKILSIGYSIEQNCDLSTYTYNQ